MDDEPGMGRWAFCALCVLFCALAGLAEAGVLLGW